MCMAGGGQGQGGQNYWAGMMHKAMVARRGPAPGSAGTAGIIGPSPSYPAPRAPGG